MHTVFIFFVFLFSTASLHHYFASFSPYQTTTCIEGWYISSSISCSLSHRPLHNIFHGLNCNNLKKSVYCSQSTTSNTLLLILAGDISSNPGPNNINFATLNARSIRNKYPAVAHFVSDNQIHCLSVTETWIKPDDTQSFLKELTPPGFVLIQKPRLTGPGGGVGCLIPKSADPTLFDTKT